MHECQRQVVCDPKCTFNRPFTDDLPIGMPFYAFIPSLFYAVALVRRYGSEERSHIHSLLGRYFSDATCEVPSFRGSFRSAHQSKVNSRMSRVVACCRLCACVCSVWGLRVFSCAGTHYVCESCRMT